MSQGCSRIINVIIIVFIILGIIYLYHEPSFVKSSIVGTIILAIIYLVRNYINTGIKYNFDKNLEGFRFSLKTLEQERGFIRDMARSFPSPSDNTKKLKQIDALNNLWEKFLEVKEYSILLATLEHLDVSAVLNYKDNPKIKEFLRMKNEQFDMNKLKMISHSAEFSRIWVSTMVWSLYLAYETIIHYGLDQLLLLHLGENPEVFLQKHKVENLIKKAIPEMETVTIDNKSLNYFLILLEQKFVSELQVQILDMYSTQETIENAKNIAKAAAEINSDINEAELKRKNPGVFNNNA